jgi:hypothetical protein
MAQFDVARNFGRGALTGGIRGAMDTLVLERTEERFGHAFGHAIVLSNSSATDGLSDTQGFQCLAELFEV